MRAEVSGLAAPGTFPASAGAGNGGTRRVGMFERRGTLSGMGFSATERVHTAYVVWVDSGCSMCRSGVSYARNTIESKAAEMPRKRSTAAHGYHGGGGVLWCRKRRYHTPQYRQESKAREPRKGVQRRMIIMEAAECCGAAKGDIIRRSTGKRVRRGSRAKEYSGA